MPKIDLSKIKGLRELKKDTRRLSRTAQLTRLKRRSKTRRTIKKAQSKRRRGSIRAERRSKLKDLASAFRKRFNRK